MKNILLAAAGLLCISKSFSQHSLTKLWSTDTTLNTPESVLFDAPKQILFVSLIGGDPSAKDGNGSIAQVGLDGKILNAHWATGLNSPKGLGKFGNTLYVADIDKVVEIDITTGKIIKKITVEGAKFLNDITVDSKGIVYVSDTQTNLVHKIENGKVSVFLKNIKGANGVLALGSNLYVLASGNLLKSDEKGVTATIATGLDESTDGVEQVKTGEFIVSCWNGVLYYVKEDGSKQQLLDTRSIKMNTADIGYDAANRVIYVPTFFKNSVVAYKLH